MGFANREDVPPPEADMTPFIDMSFQLIIFFMLLINFSQDLVDDRVKLPSSQLAKPPDKPYADSITIQLTKEKKVIVAGELRPMEDLALLLDREVTARRAKNESAVEATIIIRADKDAKTGDVQKVIKECQDKRFQKFALRAQEKK